MFAILTAYGIIGSPKAKAESVITHDKHRVSPEVTAPSYV